ncbi:uncharacterized protein LOC111614368 [Centruroides sculpturatus]|uniref:uncharacterized protein LOC111614368 n=1 Tax=Centruroides sculpturatus TaxID=218467 RepID=UPI000C6E5846|nr:uncharacterized protein LOC111614368 [Centruroides sculpturatus]
MDKLKSMKAHQVRSEACKASIEAATPPPPLPTDRVVRRIRIRPRKQYAPRQLRNTTSPVSESDQSTSDHQTPTPPRPRPSRRRTTRSVQAINEEGQQPETPVREQTHLAPTTSCLQPQTYAQALRTSPPTAMTPLTCRDSPPLRASQSLAEVCSSQRARLSPATTCTPPVCPSTAMQAAISPACTPQQSIPGTLIPLPDEDSSSIPSWVTNWKHRFDCAIDGDMLAAMVDDLVALAQDICKISDTTIQPTERSLAHSSIASDAKRIQKLFRANRKKAMSYITSGQPKYCNIEGHILHDHFKEIYAGNSQHRPTAPTVAPLHCDPDTNNPLAGPFTPAEVSARLQRCHNTAPGPDGLRYHHWSRVDPRGTILSSVFNAALRTSYIPPSWQTSNTILLHKKGNENNTSNWRPIALSNTLGKVFSACLANRLLGWCKEHNILSDAQKGFLQHEGCLDHNFLLQSTIQDARRKRRSCHIAWLDIRNAFGSVPHGTIVQCLQWCGLHEESVDIITRLLQNCTTKIRAHNGYTNEIPIRSGVKQGCPLSPLLFNIVIETAVRGIRNLQLGYALEGESIDILAYADDLVLVSSTAEGLQQQLDHISCWANWAGLQFNPAKCATLTVLGKNHDTGDITFHIQGTDIPYLRADESYSYLGIPTGFTTHHTSDIIINNLENDIKQLNNSKLAPWQKIEAVNSILLPRLTFHLLMGSNPKKRLNTLDRLIKNCVKKWLNLPQRASAEVVHLPHDHGRANVTSCNTLSDICQITHGMHLFTSRDPRVSRIATNLLRHVVRKRIRREPTQEDICTYLNGSTEGEFGRDPGDITSTWTRLRTATRRLRKSINIAWDTCDSNIVITSEGNIIPRHATSRALTALAKNALLNRLLRKPDQGKAIKLTAQHPASNHFLRDGRYTSFADWRFIHRARLSVVPLHGLRRFGQLPTKCRNCSHPKETLAHVLNHCAGNLHLATERHNAVLHRLRRAMNDKDLTIYSNQRIPGYNDNCRPDLVAVHEPTKTATIIDVVIPFENGQEAFNHARAAKIEKYASLAHHYRSQGYDTFCDAFVVGSLGAYDPGNTAVLQRLGIKRNYTKLMAKLMISDTIRWSREIYMYHLNHQQPRNQHGRSSSSQHGHSSNQQEVSAHRGQPTSRDYRRQQRRPRQD